MKRRLENLFHGWFPKEPILISTRVKVDCEIKKQPLVIPLGFDTSATQYTGFIAVFGTILGSLLIIQNILQNRIPLVSQVAWIIAGLTVGLSLGILYTLRQLNKLSKDYRIYPSGKEILILSLPIIIFFISGIVLNVILYGFFLWVRGSSFSGGLTSIYALGVSYIIVRYFLFLRYEKRENLRLMLSWFGGIVVIPKAPNNKENGYS